MYTLKVVTVLWVILSFIVPINAHSTSTKVYVWRNETGVLVFSDSPKPGAEEIEIKPENQNISPSINTSILDIKPKKIEDNFDVEIIRPTNNSTIRDNTGSVHVSGRIKPIFKQGLSLQLLIDGTPYKEPQAHSMFVLRNIERGEHKTTQARLLHHLSQLPFICTVRQSIKLNNHYYQEILLCFR